MSKFLPELTGNNFDKASSETVPANSRGVPRFTETSSLLRPGQLRDLLCPDSRDAARFRPHLMRIVLHADTPPITQRFDPGYVQAYLDSLSSEEMPTVRSAAVFAETKQAVAAAQKA